jgi:adenosylcobinamide kinase/adenosylcobinamide-phosphate guanylyltransferase
MSCPEPIDEHQAAQKINRELEGLLAAYEKHNGEWILVSNEVGMGLVPAYPLGRYFRDALGKVNQTLAKEADKVIFMVSGIPTVIKNTLD